MKAQYAVIKHKHHGHHLPRGVSVNTCEAYHQGVY